MRKVFLTSTFLFLNATNVLADDYTWNGLYAGISSGYSNTQLKLKTIDADTSKYADSNDGTSKQKLISGFGDVHIGYNKQSGRLVYGIIGSFAKLDARKKTWSAEESLDDTYNSRLSSLGLLSLRLGYTYDKALFFVRGGAAFGEYHLAINDYNTLQDGTTNSNSTGSGSKKKWLPGYSIGLGSEYKIASNWSLGAEYNYVRLSSQNLDAGGTGFDGSGSPDGSVTYVMSPHNMQTHMLGISLNYHF